MPFFIWDVKELDCIPGVVAGTYQCCSSLASLRYEVWEWEVVGKFRKANSCSHAGPLMSVWTNYILTTRIRGSASKHHIDCNSFFQVRRHTGIVIDDSFLVIKAVFHRASGNLTNAAWYFPSPAVCFLSDFLPQQFDYFCFEASSSKLLLGVGICKEMKAWFVISQSDSGISSPALRPSLLSCLALPPETLHKMSSFIGKGDTGQAEKHLLQLNVSCPLLLFLRHKRQTFRTGFVRQMSANVT